MAEQSTENDTDFTAEVSTADLDLELAPLWFTFFFFVSEGMQIQNPQKQAVLGSRKIIVKSAS